MIKKNLLLAMGILLIFCVVISVPRAAGQAVYGSVVGTVTDASGGVVPQAAVRATNEQTGVSLESRTNGSGQYTFPIVSSGIYDVTITKQGFNTFSAKGIRVTVDHISRVDAALHVGAVAQTVVVTVTTPELQTDSAEVRTEINSKSLNDLPVPIDENFESLLIAVPGITLPDDDHSYAANPSRGLTFHVNGVMGGTNDVRIDGVSAVNPSFPEVAAYIPSEAAIEEVSVVTNTFDVSTGEAGGGVINVAIKSGTNQVHGSAYESNMNSGLEADAFAFVPPPPGQTKPKLINNDLGGVIGGPIVKDKLFYFGSYEGIFLRYGAQQLVTVPTQAMRQGDFSNDPDPLYDPATGTSTGAGRTAFPGDIIPANRLDPTVLKIQNMLIPLQNETGDTDNYFASGDFNSNHDNVDSKIDWNASNKLKVVGNLGILHYGTTNPPIFGNNGEPISTIGDRVGEGIGNVYNGTISGTYVARPNLVINGYFGLTLVPTNIVPPDSNVMEGLDTLHLPGTNGPTAAYGGWPSFQVTDYTVFGETGTDTGNLVYLNDHNEFWSGDVDWIKGPHTVEFGGKILRQSWDDFDGSTGTFAFNGGVTTLNAKGAKAANLYNDYASFILGLPDSATNSEIPFDNDRIVAHLWQYSAYIQDEWQAKRKLTANYGMSWNYFPFGSRNGRGMEDYDIATNQVEICGLGGNPKNCSYHVPLANWSPALGIAYRATPTLVVRAGGSLTYDPFPYGYIRDMVANYPELLTLTVNAPNSYSAENTLEAGIPAIAVPDISSGHVTLPPDFTITYNSQNYHPDYVESWNFTVQKSLGGGWVGQVGYVADHQVKSPGELDLNLASYLGGGAAALPYYTRNGTGDLDIETAYNHVLYDSLQAQLGHTFAAGNQVNVAYTWS